MTARQVDAHKLPALLTALRLPSFQAHWQNFAERADPSPRMGRAGPPPSSSPHSPNASSPSARPGASPARPRRVPRHLAEARLPGGKTLATFDFKVLPDLPRRRIEALAWREKGAGDWIDSGTNLIAIGNSGAGKTHGRCAIGSMRGHRLPAAPHRASCEAGFRVLYGSTTISPAPPSQRRRGVSFARR